MARFQRLANFSHRRVKEGWYIMTVKELIEKLKQMDENKEVSTDGTGTRYGINTVDEEECEVVIW